MNSERKKPTEGLLSSRQLFGTKVENSRGDSLGRIEDVIFSTETGRVTDIVVAFGGFLSLGSTSFAFPWSAFRLDSLKKKAILNVVWKMLPRVGGFDKDHRPDLSTWYGDDRMRWAPSVSEPAPSSETAHPLDLVPQQDVPPLIESTSIEKGTPSKNGMEHWGKTWQSYGLDRS